MKKAILFILAIMISFTGLSQQELFDTDWILHYMVIDNETINITFPPYPFIVFNDNTTGYDVFATVNGFNYYAEFAPPSIFNEDNIIVHEGSVTLGDCEPDCELESQYFGAILLGFERMFEYEIINESNGNKILILTTPEGNTAVHGNYYLSSNEFEKNYIKLYPNPTSHVLYFDFKEMVVEQINVFSLLGANVFQTRDLNQNSSIDVSFLKNGFYFAQITFENGSNYMYKFIKE
jgi:hypothetical protein